jgi:hypothetical protein
MQHEAGRSELTRGTVFDIRARARSRPIESIRLLAAGLRHSLEPGGVRTWVDPGSPEPCKFWRDIDYAQWNLVSCITSSRHFSTCMHTGFDISAQQGLCRLLDECVSVCVCVMPCRAQH